MTAAWTSPAAAETPAVVQPLTRVQLFGTAWTAAHQASLSFTISRSLLKLMSTESVMLSNISSFAAPFSYPQSFPRSGSLPVSHLSASGGQSIGASTSASVLPMNSGLISFRIDWLDFLAVQGTLKILLSTTVLKRRFFGAQPSL